MNKNYFIIGLLIALAICLAFLLWPDKQHDTHAGTKAQVVADHDTLNAHGVDYRHVIDSLSIANYRLDSANKSLQQGQAIKEQQLNKKSAEIKTLAAQVKAANKDTALNAKIDSLINEINNMAFLLGQYEAYADSINNVNDSLKVNHEVTVMEKDKRIAELQASYDKLFKAYTELFDTSRGLMKDLKRQKLKTKVAAVLGGALALITLIK